MSNGAIPNAQKFDPNSAQARSGDGEMAGFTAVELHARQGDVDRKSYGQLDDKLPGG